MKIAIIIVSCLVAAALIGLIVWRSVKRHRQIKKVEQETGVKHVRRTFRQWLKDHKPSKRRLIQVYAALLYNANIKGFISGKIYTNATTKYVCVPGLNCYSCPGAVGACPLGAFQNALAESSVRAPYYVIGILALFGLTLARTICGWLCPVGLGQELLYKVRSPKLRKSRVTRILSYFKYVLLVALVIILPLMYALKDVPLPAFCKYICPAGTFGGALALLIHPDNADLFNLLGGQFAWKFSILIAFIILSIFIYRFFCRFFCPLGAIYGFFNRIALLGVKVDKEKCTECGKCVQVCQMDVKCVGDHECIHCGKCIPVCPTKAISWKGSNLFAKKEAVETVSVAEPALQTSSANVVSDTAATTAEMSDCQILREAKTAAGEDIVKQPKKKDARFWVQLVSGILALCLLIGALVYYNFIDVDKPVDKPNEFVGYEVGDVAPDFTVALYGSDESFTLYDKRGKLTVVNFWATWCTPCVAEIPYFDELARNKPEINVIAIHGSSTRDVNKFIEEKGWSDYTLTFGQDNLDGKDCLTFRLLGGAGTWPLTVIVDEDGVVLYNSTKSFHNYQDLENLINGFLAE